MNTDPRSRGLSLTVSWGALDAPKSARLPFVAFLRVALLLALCAGSYAVGRIQERTIAAAAAPASAVVVVEKSDSKPAAAAASPTAAPGHAVGEDQDVITPLNVRDPSALVMGPGATSAPPAADVPAPPAPRSSPLKRDRRVHPPKIGPDARF